MALDLSAMNPKSLTDPAVVALYQQYEDDYLTAYAIHTDWRVRDHGPEAAIGGDWEAGGQRQMDFLLAHGLSPEHTLLDFGCGTGRLARKVLPYLEPGRYVGMDISAHALQAAESLLRAEGLWQLYRPILLHQDGTLNGIDGMHIEIILAYAVFIHLPTDVLSDIMMSLQHIHFDRLYFTYKSAPSPCRSGLKQFAAPLSWYQETATRYGFQVERVNGMPYIPQAMAVLMRNTREK